jgi:tetratricopeptide (TPR) repeat protein
VRLSVSHRAILPPTLVAAALVLAGSLGAQPLAPKRSLTAGAAPGCVSAPAARPSGRRDNSEARRLAAQGQEAALVGDRTAARDAFARAAALNPGDERLAYDLGRSHEELADSSAAIGEYCRYLVLSPAGREAADVRSRLGRLVPPSAAQAAARVLDAFRTGVTQYERQRYSDAIASFSDVVNRAPGAAEAYYNRGLARAGAGRRAEALRDFEVYLATTPTADDRAEVSRYIEVLRRPVYDANSALTRGLVVPGLGQFYTGRPGRGVVVLGAVAGAAFFALQERTGTRTVPYVDPNGVPAPYEERFSERPYLAPALAAAVALSVAGAFEAARFARASARAATAAQPSPTSGSPSGFSLAPALDRDGAIGLRLSARF